MNSNARGPSLCVADEDTIVVGPPWNHLVPEVADGRILLIKRGLQQLGLFESVRNRTHDALEQVAGREARETVEALGIEKLHRVLEQDDYPRFISAVDELFLSDIADTLSRFSPGLISVDVPTHFFRRIYLRIRPPRARVREADFVANLGSLRGLSAHRDTWYGHPANMVNAWTPLGRTAETGGVSFYPDAWGRVLPREGSAISPDAKLSRALTFTLDPGDLLLFSARHLHASIPNDGDETRVAVSIRFTLGVPRYEDHRNGWIPYEDGRLLRYQNGWLRSYRSRQTRAFLHSTPARVGPWLRRTITGEPFRRG